MKGIILAGGTGSRLSPLTKVTNKHLLPIYNLPMIYYPIKTLTDAGIDDILIVAGREHAERFIELLGSGSEFNTDFTYKIQDGSKGIAHALGLAKRFANGDNVAVVLGDNIFENKFDFTYFKEGAKLFLKRVPDAHRFGVARVRYELIDNNGYGFVVTGLYLYDNNVFDFINSLKPSKRGEYEITDINNMYIKDGKMDYQIIDGFWSDAGTFESLYGTSSFIRDNVRKN
jgi:glucose-1-phosphate thymidylyltransferase